MVLIDSIPKESTVKEEIEKGKLKEKLNSETENHGRKGGKEEVKIMCTHTDGLLPRKLELRDYIREKEPDIFYFTETKLSEDTQVKLENYTSDTWRKDRNGKKRRNNDNGKI